MNETGFPHDVMYLSESDDNLYFNDTMLVHNQIQCCAQCLRGYNQTYYYALYKHTDKLCVCQRDFDWRSISSTSGVYEVKRIEIREG